MRLVSFREQVRNYDRLAIEQASVPGLLLMENAGRGAADIIAEALGPSSHRCEIVCGGGNNGGDGFVVGRHLRARGHSVVIRMLTEPERVTAPDAKANLEAWLGLGGEVHVCDSTSAMDAAPLSDGQVIIDALFGTGLSRQITGLHAHAIDAINRSGLPVYSLDLPSGIDADTGQILGTAVRATHTITFARYKPGLLQGPGAEHAGQLHHVALGIFDEGIRDAAGHCASILDEEQVRVTLPPRKHDAHKYNAGHALIVAGRDGKLGAAQLAALGALRTGAGLVTLASWPECRDALRQLAPEIMTTTLEHDTKSMPSLMVKKAAVGIGPGLGVDERARTLIEWLALKAPIPVILDADAITCFAGRPECLKQAPAPRIVTPHAGELSALLNEPVASLQNDRLTAATRAAEKTGCTIVFKGANSIVAAPNRTPQYCLAGNPALATAGSGDVLTGIITALAGQMNAFDAARTGVFLHATVADQWRANHRADRGMIASDLIQGLPPLIASIASSIPQVG